MSQNPYAAPSLDAEGRPEASSTDDAAWFAVGTKKLMVMSIMTLGLYGVYWFERQYRFQKRFHGETTRPLARAIFSVFYAHDLFRRVAGAAAHRDLRPVWSTGTLATIFIVSAVLSRFLDRLSDKMLTGSAGAVASLVSLALVLGLAYPMVQVQGTLNQVLEREARGYDRNEGFTVWNWIVAGCGALVILAAVVGTFLPEG